jgi:REP-associated tyrosine transposase
MSALKRLDLKGRAVFFVTTTVNKRVHVFNNRKPADIAIVTLRDNLAHYNCSLLGYVLMPSHLHILICLSKAKYLSKFMQTFKILSSKRIKVLQIQKYESRFNEKNKLRLWQSGFDDVLIVSEKQFLIKLNYIHTNPVKAGIAQREIDWKYSSACDWLEGTKGILPVDTQHEWIY